MPIDEPRVRTLARAQPAMRLRIWHGGYLRAGDRKPAWVNVEWAGRVGHPSSYAFLGGAGADRSRISVEPTGARFRESLAGRLDDVRYGLEPEYAAAIEVALAGEPRGVLVGTAAQAEIGSSADAFARVARFLSAVLATDVPTEDEAVWRLFDRVSAR